MAEVTTDVIRTKRIEVVDDEGRVRAVLGWLWKGDDNMHGVGVYGDTGHMLGWVAAGTEPEVGLAHGGNVVAVLQVGGEGGGELFLADPNGGPIEAAVE